MSEMPPPRPPQPGGPPSAGLTPASWAAGPPAPGAPVAQPPGPAPEWSVGQPFGVSGRVLVTDERPASGGHVAAVWVITVLTLGYMLPWAVAATRGKSNVAAIALINLLVGWTFVGWVVALVMACQSHRAVGVTGNPTIMVAQHVSTAGTPPGWYPVPAGGRRYWDGAAWTDHWAP